MRKIYLHTGFFIWLLCLMGLYTLSFFWVRLTPIAQGALYVFALVSFLDFLLVFTTKKGIEAQRVLPERLSNSDENLIEVHIKSLYPFPMYMQLVDEIPFQFQKRDFEYTLYFRGGQEQVFQYYKALCFL